MKTITIILTIVFAMTEMFVEAQTPEIYVINFKADWCPVCKAHGERYANEVVKKLSMDKRIQFIERDMTSPETMKQSDVQLEKIGVLPALANSQYTGVLYLVNAKTKTLVSEVSVSQPTTTIVKYIEETRSGKTIAKNADDPKVYYLAIQYLKPGGMEKLNEFNQKAMPILEKYGFKAEGAMKPYHVLPGIGGNTMEVPDQIVIFSAPNEGSLLQLVMDKDYQAILPLRAEALKELTFIATKKMF